MKHFIIFSLALLLVGFAASAIADTVTLTPTGDMYTDPDHATGHPIGELWTADWPPPNNHQRIMMKFDLSQLSGAIIDNAVLKVNRFFGCPSGDPTTTNFYDITQDWDENTWPENQHIAHGTTVWTIYVFSVNGWHTIDLTSLVQSWNTGTLPNYGFVIQAINSKFSKFYSKEASNQSLRPYLEVEYQPAVNNPPVITLSMPATPAFIIEQNEEQTFMVAAEDPDGDSLSFSWTVNQQGSDADTSYFSYVFTDTGAFDVKVVVSDGELADSALWNVTVEAVNGVFERNRNFVPEYSLSAYPNPFNAKAVIRFELRDAGFVSLAVYDVQGREVQSLVNGHRSMGHHEVVWDAEGISSGMFFVKLQAGDFTQNQKMILLK